MTTVVTTLVEEVYHVVRDKSGLTEAQIARMIFRRNGYPQQVNPAYRQLVEAERVERHGSGTSWHPYTYSLKQPKVRRLK